MPLTITTNRHKLPLLSGYELTRKEREELDYIAPVNDESTWSECTDRFFRYRGSIYDVYEFVRIVPRSEQVGFEHGVDADSPLLKWDGIQTNSYFSGIVVKYCEGYEYVQAGLAMS